jgi:hypothetical protein
MERREYPISISINGQPINKIIIDTHFEEKHQDSINDSIIIELVKIISGENYEPETSSEGFHYFVNDRIQFQNKFYKLIWLLEDYQIYIGVVNAYRRD